MEHPVGDVRARTFSPIWLSSKRGAPVLELLGVCHFFNSGDTGIAFLSSMILMLKKVLRSSVLPCFFFIPKGSEALIVRSLRPSVGLQVSFLVHYLVDHQHISLMMSLF